MSPLSIENHLLIKVLGSSVRYSFLC